VRQLCYLQDLDGRRDFYKLILHIFGTSPQLSASWNSLLTQLFLLQGHRHGKPGTWSP